MVLIAAAIKCHVLDAGLLRTLSDQLESIERAEDEVMEAGAYTGRFSRQALMRTLRIRSQAVVLAGGAIPELGGIEAITGGEYHGLSGAPDRVYTRSARYGRVKR